MQCTYACNAPVRGSNTGELLIRYTVTEIFHIMWTANPSPAAEAEQMSPRLSGAVRCRPGLSGAVRGRQVRDFRDP
jgi:hypothetical protein